MRLRSCVVLLALLASTDFAVAQGVRGNALTTMRYAEVRPMRRDTVDSAQVTLNEFGRPMFEGRAVQCAAGLCEYFIPGAPESALMLSQDVSLTAWGFGVDGLSATVFLRARSGLAGTFDWPQQDDHFDAILAYAELGRERYRVRVGRQRNVSGLGFTSFDGIDARYDATARISVEAYAGRSLGRGLESPRHDALDALEDFLPDREAILLGAAGEFDVGRGISGTVRSQTEFWADGSGRLSERASLDVRAARIGPLQAELSADYDVAFNTPGNAYLTLRYPLRSQNLTLEATARRYRPFFEMWTIWGFFSPVGYGEAELQAAWRPMPTLDVSATLGLRQYEETHADAFLIAPEDDAQRFMLRTRARLPHALVIDAEYRLEHGFGAYANSAEVSGSWERGERLRVGAYATAFQQVLEFRTGDTRVLGFGGNADFQVSERLSVDGGATLYLQDVGNRASGADWNQKRAWLSLEYTLGSDPGMTGGVR